MLARVKVSVTEKGTIENSKKHEYLGNNRIFCDFRFEKDFQKVSLLKKVFIFDKLTTFFYERI